MSRLFESVSLKLPKKNRFGLSFRHKFTADLGYLVPIYVQDVIPNDSFRLSMANLIRVAPMLAPALSDIDVYFHFFFVPNRLIWTPWPIFITGSKNGKRLSPEDVPAKPRYVFKGGGFTAAIQQGQVGERNPLENGSLADYLGFQTFSKNNIPTGVGTAQYPLDLMPFLAYQKIWEDYYRDENLDNDVPSRYYDKVGDTIVDSANIPDSDLFTLKRRAWRKDYFTSALPFSQKGDDVLIPGSSSVPNIAFSSGNVRATGILNGLVPSLSSNDKTLHLSSPDGMKSSVYYTDAGGEEMRLSVNAGTTGDEDNSLGINPSDLNSYLNVSQNITEGTIRELRRAYAAQAFLERRAVGGTRYIEQNLAFFGARSSDARMQRAEFLGGCKSSVVISQLLQTSASTQDSPLGQPAGNAVNAGSGNIFARTFEEYGFIVGIMSVMPRADYMQGIPKMYLKHDVYDYYWPQFANIGEQPIENQELYFNPFNSDANEGTFGYTPRYAEYRHRRNIVSGDFKDSLKFWTLARDFSATPQLNNNFIACDPSDRIFAVEDAGYHHLWCECAFDVSAVRPITKHPLNL